MLKSDCNTMRSAPVTAFCIAVGQTLFPPIKKRLAHGTIISKVRIEISCIHMECQLGLQNLPLYSTIMMFPLPINKTRSSHMTCKIN